MAQITLDGKRNGRGGGGGGGAGLRTGRQKSDRRVSWQQTKKLKLHIMLVYSIFWPVLVCSIFWPVLVYYIFRPILVYFIIWPILIYYIFWPIVAHSSLNRDYRQFYSFNREGSNFRVISAGAGSERALLSRARVSGRKGFFEQMSPCLAIRSPLRQTTKGEPLSSKLVDEHITIHCIFILF